MKGDVYVWFAGFCCEGLADELVLRWRVEWVDGVRFAEVQFCFVVEGLGHSNCSTVISSTASMRLHNKLWIILQLVAKIDRKLRGLLHEIGLD